MTLQIEDMATLSDNIQLKTRELGTSKGDGGEGDGERGIEGQATWCSGMPINTID